MAQTTCEYCGTEYEETMEHCPLCGTPNESYLLAEEDEEAPEEHRTARRRRGGAREAPKERRLPRWAGILICVALSLAVLAIAWASLRAVGVIQPMEKKPKPAKEEPAVEAPAEEPGDGEAAPAGTQGPVLCSGLSVTPSKVGMGKTGLSVSLKAMAQPEGCSETVTWVSSNPAVCTVDSAGTLISVGEGSATVTAACGTETATVSVTCDFSGALGSSEEAVTSDSGPTLNYTDISLFSEGETASLSVEDAGDARIAWKSSDKDVCTVDSDGTVTAAGGGVATVTATVDGAELSCTVRCRFTSSDEPDPDTVENPAKVYKLDHDDVTLGVGESFEISVVDGVSGGWHVTDTAVISIDKMGNVTGLKAGTAKVYTEVEGQRLECVVHVK